MLPGEAHGIHVVDTRKPSIAGWTRIAPIEGFAVEIQVFEVR